MQRYHGGSCTSAVNNNTTGGPSARDSSRVDSASLPPNFSRRPLQLTPYKLKCDKEHLNSRLGPPDFLPQTPNCPEETLTKEYVQFGYRETVEGLEEVKEISLTQVPTFTKPVIFKCKEVNFWEYIFGLCFAFCFQFSDCCSVYMPFWFLVMRRCDRLAVVSFKRGRDRLKKHWGVVIRQDMTHLQLIEDITLDRKL